MADRVTAGPVPREALEFFRAKGYKVGFSHRDVWNEEHRNAFTVAKAMSMDVLTAIRGEVDRALAEGRTLEQFKAELTPTLQRLGWWGQAEMIDPATGKRKTVQLGSPRRLQRIFETNLRTARAAGQWQRAQRTKRALPFFKYLLGPSEEHRQEHVKLEGLVLPVDDPFWDSHFPPNGWGCKCHLRQVTRREAEQTPDMMTAPILPMRKFVNRRTGATQNVPHGVDPDFNHNPGKTRPVALQQNLQRAQQAFQQAVAQPAKKPVSAALKPPSRGVVAKAVKHAMAKVDAVHSDGDLPRVPVSNVPKMNALGQLKIYSNGTYKMEIKGRGEWPELTTVHEAGHLLDHSALGKKGYFASATDPLFGNFRKAAEASRAIGAFRQQLGSTSFTERKMARYFLEPHEIFARAYAQYIALRSADPLLRAQVDRVRTLRPNRQWEDDDFEPIARELDSIFKAKGWL